MKFRTLFLVSVAISATAFSQQFPGGPPGGQRHAPPQMDEATKAKFEACSTEAGMPARDSGTRPNREQLEKFKACLKAQGIELPGRPHGGDDFPPPPPPPESN